MSIVDLRIIVVLSYCCEPHILIMISSLIVLFEAESAAHIRKVSLVHD
jgi:hypothetical protein